MRQARKLRRFVFRYRAAIDRAQKIIQQSLAGGGIVEDITNQSCFGGLLDKVAQPFRSGVQTFKKESIYRGIAGRELARMQVPALVKATDQRMLNMIVMQLPGAMDHRAILIDLIGGEGVIFGWAVRTDRHDIRGAVRQPDAGARK